MESIYDTPILKDGRKLNALIIGGSGASGRELIDHIFENPNYESITVLSRRRISRWENLPENKLKKFIYIQVENLDDVLDLEKNPEGYKKIIPEMNYDTLFCCLGSRSGRPDFIKVDLDFVVATAKITEMMKIHHLSVVSSQRASSDSWFNYLKTKGQAEDVIMKIDIPCISILKPGFITDRDESRTGEKIAKYLPFFDKITSKNLGLAMMNMDLLVHLKEIKQKKKWEHKEIEEMVYMQPSGCCYKYKSIVRK